MLAGLAGVGAHEGLRAGDEVVEVEGRRGVEFGAAQDGRLPGGEARGDVGFLKPSGEPVHPPHRLGDDALERGEARSQVRRGKDALPFFLDAAPLGGDRQAVESGDGFVPPSRAGDGGKA